MNKKVILTVLCTLLSISLIFGVAYASGGIKIVVNGKTVAADVAPRVINNRVMVPISFVSQALGADVTWDQKTQMVGVKSYGIAPVDVWKDDLSKLSRFNMSSINNTVQVFMTGMDSRLNDLFNKSVMTGLETDFSKDPFIPMGPQMLSTQITDIRAINVAPGKPFEFQVKVGVQTWWDDKPALDYWDITVIQHHQDNKMEFLVKKFERTTSTPVEENRLFPGYIIK